MPGWQIHDPVTGERREWRAPTEDSVACRLAAAQAGRLRYCHASRAWFVWDGALWRRDRAGAAARLAREAARADGTEPGGRRVMAAGRPAFVAGVLRFAQGEPALAVGGGDADWDADPWLLGTPAGPVDLRSGAFAPADPNDGISRAAVTPAPPGEPATAWCRFLDETFGDTMLVAFVQRLLGYMLTGTADERIVALGCGASGTGKTTFLATILHVMGDYALALDPAALARPEAGRTLAALAGTRLVALPDADGAWPARRLARLTGGDPLATSFDAPSGAGRAEPRGAVPTFKLLATASTPPRLTHADAGLRRRLCLVPFKHRPARPDRALAARLRDEAPAILRWMIDGALAWQAGGLAPPLAVRVATAEALGETDAFDRFIAQSCIEDKARTATATDLLRAWCAFAAATGEPAGSWNQFAEAMESRGFTRDRTNATRFYRGLGLRAAATEVTGDGCDG